MLSKGIAGLLLAVVSVALFRLSDRLAYWAGHEVKPEAAVKYVMAAGGLLLLVIVFNIFYAISGIRRFKNYRLFRILIGLFAILICLYPLFTDWGFGGWEGFQKRMREDIRPRDLEAWLRSVEATNVAPKIRRTITPEEFAIFGPTNVSYPMPRLEIYPEYQPKLPMLCWGSSIQTWAIVLGDWPGGSIRLRWEDNLYFYTFSK